MQSVDFAFRNMSSMWSESASETLWYVQEFVDEYFFFFFAVEAVVAFGYDFY